MPIPLRLLIVEDQPADAELLLAELERHGFQPSGRRVETAEEYVASLNPQLDLILADHRLPRFDATAALRLLKESGLDIPLFVVSGYVDDAQAVEFLRQGAADYLLKDRLARLGAAVRQALDQRRLRDDQRRADERLRDSENRWRALIENSLDGIALLDGEGLIQYASPAATKILGYEPEEFLGRSAFEFFHPEDLPGMRAQFARLLLEPGSSNRGCFRCLHKEGDWRWIERVSTNLLHDPCVRAIVSNYRDVTHRRQAEQHASELRLAQRIQQRLFPPLPRPAGYDIGAGSYPATATGGDYFDFLTLGDGGLGIVIGDVSGHGFGPALLMAEVHAYLRALALSYQENGRRSGDGVGRLVSLLNQALNRELASDHFVTLMLGRLDIATGSFVYVGAGHPWAYVLDSSGTLKARLKSSSLPVGILPDGDFAASGTVRLEGGDLVVFLTDGVLDARAPDGTPFGAQRVLDVVRLYRHDPASLIVANLYHAVCAFSQNVPQDDDITTIVVKVGADGASA